jgi:hypothetical protein
MLGTLANKQALADGVLDLKGDLKEIKLGGGRQAFLARLQQLLGPDVKSQAPDGKSTPSVILTSPLPVDRAAAFGRRAREMINGALMRCEERYPNEGSHSVLLVVVEGNPAQHQNRLASVHQELFSNSDPLAPVQLEIIDRATDEAIQRLMAAGLITKTTRASRVLFPGVETAPAPPLSAEERAKAAEHRALAARKLKMAQLLGEGGLGEETRAPLLESIHVLARALAVENRLPEPAALDDAHLPPLSHGWGESLPVLRAFLADSNHSWQAMAQALTKCLKTA